jgi:hypothetical protein
MIILFMIYGIYSILYATDISACRMFYDNWWFMGIWPIFLIFIALIRKFLFLFCNAGFPPTLNGAGLMMDIDYRARASAHQNRFPRRAHESEFSLAKISDSFPTTGTAYSFTTTAHDLGQEKVNWIVSR